MLDYNKVTVAISRPKKLSDILSKTFLGTPKHLDIQKIRQKLNNANDQSQPALYFPRKTK